jgi:hypothetical protein
LNANGSYTYVPNPGFKGTDTFTYKASDGRLDSNSAPNNMTLFTGEFLRMPNEGQKPSAAAAPLQALTPAEVQALVRQAVQTRTAAAGRAPGRNALRQVHVQFVDMPATVLGMTDGITIWLDRDAGGHGWFLDATPADNTEFTVPDAGGDLAARVPGPAAGRIDLLTVLMHEMGHILGLEHTAGGVMAPTLGSGVRRLVTDKDRRGPASEAPLVADRGLPAVGPAPLPRLDALLAPAALFPKVRAMLAGDVLANAMGAFMDSQRGQEMIPPCFQPPPGTAGRSSEDTLGERRSGVDLASPGGGSGIGQQPADQGAFPEVNWHRAKEMVLRDFLADWDGALGNIGRQTAH